MSILSAISINQPDDATLYYHYEPVQRGSRACYHWWNEVKKIIRTEQVELPVEIFGNTLVHYAHKSDVFRLRKLLDHGGIYLDCDTICIKPFTPLLKESAVMAYQPSARDPLLEECHYGLGNSTMLSEPNNVFMQSWWNQYTTFRSLGKDDYWDEHSVRIPVKLDKTGLTILNYKSFFYPMICDFIDVLFNSTNLELMSESYSCHLWETVTLAELKLFTPEFIQQHNSNYCQLARRVFN